MVEDSTVKIKSYVSQAIDGVQNGSQKSIVILLIKIAGAAKAFAPIDTGELRNSIMWKTRDSHGGLKKGPPLKEKVTQFLEGIVGSAVVHGIYQEFGTLRMAAHPWLRPAISVVVNGMSYMAAVKKAMKESVEQKVPTV